METGPRNAASEQANLIMTSLNDGSSWRRRDWYDDGFVREDRRRIIGLPTVGIDGFIDQLRSWFEIGPEPPTFSVGRVVEVVGDSGAIVVLRNDFGSEATEMLAVGSFDSETQRLKRLVTFDLDDIDAAVAELHRLHPQEQPDDE